MPSILYRILFVFINSMYSFWWDISMDWNLINITLDTTQTSGGANEDGYIHKLISLPPASKRQLTPTLHFRRQLYFSQPVLYFAAAMLDFLLRITWSLKLSSHIYIRQLDKSALFMEVLEVIRRWVWVIFRMESEWVKKVYNTLPSQQQPLDNLRMNLLDRKPSGLLSPIEEEEPSF